MKIYKKIDIEVKEPDFDKLKEECFVILEKKIDEGKNHLATLNKMIFKSRNIRQYIGDISDEVVHAEHTLEKIKAANKIEDFSYIGEVYNSLKNKDSVVQFKCLPDKEMAEITLLNSKGELTTIYRDCLYQTSMTIPKDTLEIAIQERLGEPYLELKYTEKIVIE